MLKKQAVWIAGMIVGILLVTLGFFMQDEAFKTISGILIGIGSGLFGLSVAQFYMISYEHKNPEIVKQNEIEFKDERSVMIRDKAKAKAGDITSWCVLGVAWINILVDGSLWITLICCALSALHVGIGLYLMTKYDKEL